MYFFCAFQNLNYLSEKEEARVEEILRQISDQVKKRRIMMYQYFKDYDRVSTLDLRVLRV